MKVSMGSLKSILLLIGLCLLWTDALFAVSATSHSRIERQVISHPHKEDQIEFFILKPKKEGPFPIIFLLHGNQPVENSLGGEQLVDYGYLERFANVGIVAVSVSMPGYGKSTGHRDFGGIESQNTIIALIEYFKDLSFVDSSRMGIYGISRGAQLAGMVSSHYPNLSLQILESGFYDLVAFQTDIPNYLQDIKSNIISEGGNTLEALIERSPLYHVNNMKASTLILQGELDDRRQLPSAKKLHEQLLRKGIDSQLKLYRNELHSLPADKWDMIIPFVREQFFGIYGIGIKVSKAVPVMQILKIHPNSPASKVKKLKVGDAILSLSPMNDDTEISTLRMPNEKFISLVLGKKDSELRLRVQHFDLSIEDVVLKRG